MSSFVKLLGLKMYYMWKILIRKTFLFDFLTSIIEELDTFLC